jgi:predicted kinase
MPKLYVLVGVPGAGKSTWVKNQDWAKDCSYVSTDMWVDMEAERQGKTYNEIFKDYMPHAVKLMANHVELAREKGMDIIWDQTSCTVGSRMKKFRMLPDYYAIAVVFKTPEREELDRRLAGRPGKNIPEYVVQSMIDSWQEPSSDEGFDEIWHV